jgi:hypothetical protein
MIAKKSGEGRFSTNAESGKTRVVRVAIILHIAYFKQLGDESRNRTRTESFSKTHYSAITTPPPEANSLITNERQ